MFIRLTDVIESAAPTFIKKEEIIAIHQNKVKSILTTIVELSNGSDCCVKESTEEVMRIIHESK